MKNILLVDDHRLVRQAVKRALGDSGFNVIGEADDGQAGVDMVNELSPDIVVLDITMPIMDGLTALKIIKKAKPETKVIMLKMHLWLKLLILLHVLLMVKSCRAK